MTKIIGLTGGIGSGKSTAAKLFNDLGIESIDADDVAREVVQPGDPCLKLIIEAFGDDFALEDGSLNRAKLRQEVFANKDSLKLLESITHPAIRQRLVDYLNAMTGPYALLVHPLLFEKQQDSLCDYTIAISLPYKHQLNRAAQRDHNSLDQIKRIMDTQLNNEERCAKADFILENTGTSAELSGKVSELHKKLLDILDLK